MRPDERTEWQKKYDASIAQLRREDDDMSIGEAGALEASSVGAYCLPGQVCLRSVSRA